MIIPIFGETIFVLKWGPDYARPFQDRVLTAQLDMILHSVLIFNVKHVPDDYTTPQSSK